MRLLRLTAVLLLAAAAPAQALAPDDFAWGWPLQLATGGDAHQVELSPEVHAVLQTDDQRDLQIFDATGTPVPIARYRPPQAEEAERRWGLPTFSLGRPASVAAVDARLQVERAPDGSLHRIAADLGTADTGAARIDHLVDASALEGPIDALELRWSAPGDVRARFAVEASGDLERWRILVAGATVLSLREGDATLERRRIDLPAGSWRYLRLRALDDVELGTLQVEAIAAPTDAAPALQWVEAALLSSGRDGVATFQAPGSFDVRRVRVLPQGGRRLTEVLVRSGSEDEAAVRARLTVVELRQDGERVLHDEAPVQAGPRSRVWEVTTDPPLDVPPRLLLGALPDRFAFLAQGQGPWVLAAGSGDARHRPEPVQAAIDAIERREGSGWQPPAAALGERRELGGPAALVAGPRPLPWATLGLWAVLLAGAALVVALAVRLLRSGATIR